MTSNSFKQDLFRIECDLKRMNGNNLMTSKTRLDVMQELYCLLHSNQSIVYFLSIFQRTGAQNAGVAKDIEDYISEAWTAAYECYNPDKGALLPFLTVRVRNKIIDDERKMGGLVGLPRDSKERARLKLVSVDQENAPSGFRVTKSENGILDDYSYDQYNSEERFEIEYSDLLISDLLRSFSAVILDYTHKYPVQRWEELENDYPQGSMLKKRKKYFYYRLFYSSDVISIIKENRSIAGFQYERETMDAMHFGFTNFVTDRSVPYLNYKEITPVAILMKPLARNCDVLPARNAAVMNNSRLSIPIQNEVVRGYMEHIESVRISSSNISQMKQKYRCDMRELLLIR